MLDCVKYDLFEDKVLVGMLVTSRSKTYANFCDGKAFSFTSKSLLFPSTKYVLQDEFGNDFAKVFLKRAWFVIFKFNLLTGFCSWADRSQKSSRAASLRP